MQTFACSNRRGSASASGFTLVELMIVAVMLGIVGVIASQALIHTVTGRGATSSAEATAATSQPDAPLSPAALLVRLAGVAILLFGAGFMYTAELRKPGQLDRFRLGQFLLLALTYSLFFVAFAVLHNHDVEAWLAVGIAAALSYPLVALHIATIVDFRFALGTAMPLTALTTGIVVTGVYGGDLRGFIYLGMVALVVAFLTLSYPRLARQQEGARLTRERAFEQSLPPLLVEANATQALLATGESALLLRDTDERRGLRRWVEQRVETAQRALDTFEAMRGHFDAMAGAAEPTTRRAACESGGALAAELERRLPQVRTSLAEAIRNLTEQRTAAQQRPPEHPALDEEHCIACGHTVQRDAHFCGNCGKANSERRACPRCGDVLHLPQHLMRPDLHEPAPATHCRGCGCQHAHAG